MLTESDIRQTIEQVFADNENRPQPVERLRTIVIMSSNTTPRQWEEHCQEFDQFVSDYMEFVPPGKRVVRFRQKDPYLYAVGMFQYFLNTDNNWVVNSPTLSDYFTVKTEVEAKQLAVMLDHAFKAGKSARSQEIKKLLGS